MKAVVNRNLFVCSFWIKSFSYHFQGFVIMYFHARNYTFGLKVKVLSKGLMVQSHMLVCNVYWQMA
jgi:hypothetical protein